MGGSMRERKIVEYRIVFTPKLRDFERSVNELIEKGFQPYNNFQRLNNGDFYQAMVRYDDYVPPVDVTFDPTTFTKIN